jgi:conjugative relaxase-like TrwC/TraI family protein
MLSIGKLALGQQAYYEKQVAQGRDDYYSGRGEAPGEWAGAGAAELGLAGHVEAGQFSALLEGRDPREPETQLRSSTSQPAVAALDLTFSAPKSVSVLFAVAPAEVSASLVDCHEEAVRAALGYLEDEAVFVRRGKGGARFEHAGGLIAAAYRHRMSRALDPQLHTHVVAANLARGEDRRFTALHHPSIYRAARTAGYLYQAHLRSAVRDRLGLEWGPVAKGAAELDQLPIEVLGVFSQRRAQVQAAIDAKEAELGRELTRAERSAWGTIATRSRKEYDVETHTWREEVTARAAEHGLDRELVDHMVAAGEERLGSGAVAVDGALEYGGRALGEDGLGDVFVGPSGLTELANTFDGASVLRAFAQSAPQGARVDVVREFGERFSGRDDVLETMSATLTSADLVAREKALIKLAMGRAGEGAGRLSDATVADAVGGSSRTLNSGQARAVRAVVGSSNGVDVVEALAGTGKTYTAGALRELYEEAGYAVIGVAPSARAARELAEQAGIASRTLDSRLLSIANGRSLPDRCVVIFDEAGMASTRQSERLLAHAAEVGGKVIAIGDPGQLPSVQAGGWLRAIGERLGAVKLTEVMRQRDPAERRALAALHDGNPQRWIDWATDAKRIEVTPDDGGVLDQAVAEWAVGVEEHGIEQSVLIARSNETRRALNDLARERRRHAGVLSEDRIYGPVTIAVGDRVICRSNVRDLDVDNGTRGTVRHADPGGLVVETDARTIRRLPAAYVAEHVEHAYALTGHGMQGATVERATVVASVGELTRGWSYTALSRARGNTRLLVRDAAADPGEREEIGPAVPTERREPEKVLPRVARRMLERDDEDLAIDQLATPGRADDPQLSPQTDVDGEPLQEQTARRAEPPTPGSPRTSLRDLREQLGHLRAQFAALPTSELDRLDELDREARDLTARRDNVRAGLERLPQPRERRFGRREDPHLAERTRLSSTVGGLDVQLERTLTARATLARQLGDAEPVRAERDSLVSAIDETRSEQTQVLDRLVQRELSQSPPWVRDALGDRPVRRSAAERWDRASRTLARYRIEYEIGADAIDTLGPRPAGGDQRRDYERAQRAREQLARELGRDVQQLELLDLS